MNEETLAAIAQKLTDLYENLYGREGQGDMLLVRKASHEQANWIQKHDARLAALEGKQDKIESAHKQLEDAHNEQMARGGCNNNVTVVPEVKQSLLAVILHPTLPIGITLGLIIVILFILKGMGLRF